jgi:transglutaminase-like putative cysteine protease
LLTIKMFKLSRMNQFWRLGVSLDWRQNNQGSPLLEVEDSISLRVLVLALVIIGIVAMDIAASTTFSFWAIPISVVGTVWGYYYRRQANTAIKFCIAIGMLVALGGFFGRIFGELNDTRLGLAELLIQLQVLHSFDVPRRKDLGYSIVIGLILLGVAATLSQTLAFAPVLLLFLAIALPTLVFNYRSQLGINNSKFKSQKSKEKKLSSGIPSYFLLFGVVVGLGLVVFALLPRFPGYQLRTFPVSSPIEVNQGFTGRSIINPGYVRQGNANNQGNGRGSNQQSQNQNGEPGKVDDSFYYGFNSQMNQNLRGEMKPQVVMRVRSQAEGFWRVLAFDRYTGKGWEISRNDDVTTIKRSPWSYQIYIPPAPISGRTKEVVQTYTVVSDLPNLIPAMSYPKELYFPTPMVALDKEGGLRAPVGLSKDLTYTVISDVPLRDRTLLGKTGNDYPRSIKNHYLQIPTQIAAKVKQRTEEILAEYDQQLVWKSETKKTLDSTYEKVLYLAQYVKQHYSIPENPLEFPHLNDNEDLVEAFLFKYKGGYPDHFSTVLTMMLRSIGVPARLVAGFGAGEFNPFTGMYVVRNTDAYAMTEVYFPKYGWFAFDPIPNHPLIPPSVEDVQTFTVLRQFWQWVAGWLPSPMTGLLNNVFSWIGKAIAWFFGLFTQGWLGILTGLIVGTTTGFFAWLGWTQWKQWRTRRWLGKLPPMESLYQQMLQWTAKKGLGKHPAQTPLEYAKVSYQHHGTTTAQVIDEICQAYVSWRYGGQKPNLNQLRQRWEDMKKTSGDRVSSS